MTAMLKKIALAFIAALVLANASLAFTQPASASPNAANGVHFTGGSGNKVAPSQPHADYTEIKSHVTEFSVHQVGVERDPPLQQERMNEEEIRDCRRCAACRRSDAPQS
jgi:hypothetical protein